MLDAVEIFSDAWSEGWEPPALLTVSEWADLFRMLSGKSASEPGPWRTSRTPYLREPMDQLSALSIADQVVLMFGTQLGKSESGNNWIGYNVDVEPGPMMMVQPTTITAKDYSRQRLAPMIEATPVLRSKMTLNRSRDDSNTTLTKDFAGGVLIIRGANSASGLRSMPVRYLFLDEIDAYPQDVDGEGDPIMLAMKRTETFARRKILKTSTPTIKDFSRIETAFLAGDQRYFHVPCPHCEERQVLKWGQVKWRDQDPATAHYVCVHCGAEIEEHHKSTMLALGEWIAERPGDGIVVSYHLASLYSPLGFFSWSEAVEQFLAAKTALDAGDASLMKTFVNTVLAETWEEQGASTKPTSLAARAEEYRLREVPAGGLILLASGDVQGNRIEIKVKAWGRSEESWVVDYIVFHGDPTDMLTAKDPRLDDYLRSVFMHASGHEMRISAALIDSGGHHTQDVYQFCRDRRHRHIIAIKGHSQPGKPILGKPTDVEINHRGQRLKKGGQLWMVGSDTAKTQIYGRLNVQNPGPGFMHFSKELPAEYYEQLTAERLVTRYHRGHARYEWIKPNGRRNEALDLEVYNLAAAHYVGIPRMREHEWAKLERQFKPDLFTGPAAVPATQLPEAADEEKTAPKVKSPVRLPRRNFATGWKK